MKAHFLHNLIWNKFAISSNYYMPGFMCPLALCNIFTAFKNALRNMHPLPDRFSGFWVKFLGPIPCIPCVLAMERGLDYISRSHFGRNFQIRFPADAPDYRSKPVQQLR